jgi:hypothetical protein
MTVIPRRAKISSASGRVGAFARLDDYLGAHFVGHLAG